MRFNEKFSKSCKKTKKNSIDFRILKSISNYVCVSIISKLVKNFSIYKIKKKIL